MYAQASTVARKVVRHPGVGVTGDIVVLENKFRSSAGTARTISH